MSPQPTNPATTQPAADNPIARLQFIMMTLPGNAATHGDAHYPQSPLARLFSLAPTEQQAYSRATRSRSTKRPDERDPPAIHVRFAGPQLLSRFVVNQLLLGRREPPTCWTFRY
jgi:hypothetical protein